MHPIMRWEVLPSDILSVIMEEVVAAWEANSVHDFTELGLSLRSFVATCHKWREVALSSPRLWRNVYSPDLGEGGWPYPEDNIGEEDSPGSPSVSPTNPRRKAAAGRSYYPFVLCMERSGAVPLKLYAEATCGLCELLMYLEDRKNLERVYFIEVRDFFRPIEEEYECGSDSTVLEKLRSPNLRSLSLSAFAPVFFVDVYDILSLHKSIERIYMKNVWWSWSDMEARTLPLIMPRLREVIVSHHQQSAVNKTFDFLGTPALRRLAISKTYVEAAAIPTMGPVRMEQTFPLVIEAVMDGSLTTGDIASILAKTPNVETLQLRNGIYHDFDDLFALLEYRPQLPLLCPKLRHLVLHYCPVSAQAVNSMVESRLTCTQPLECATSAADQWEQWPTEALSRLAKFVQIKVWVPTVISDPWVTTNDNDTGMPS